MYNRQSPRNLSKRLGFWHRNIPRLSQEMSKVSGACGCLSLTLPVRVFLSTGFSFRKNRFNTSYYTFSSPRPSPISTRETIDPHHCVRASIEPAPTHLHKRNQVDPNASLRTRSDRDFAAADRWLADRLNEKGVASPSGRLWNQEEVKKLRGEDGLTWHHHGNMSTMQLIHKDLNNFVGHLGGRTLKDESFQPRLPVRRPKNRGDI